MQKVDAKGGCKKQILISVGFEYQGLILQLDNYQEWNNSAFRIIQICVYLTFPSHLEIRTSCGLVSPSWLMKFDYPETECS